MTTDTVPKQATSSGDGWSSAAWPRAPACSPRGWPRCSSCSPPTPWPTGRRPRQRAAARRPRVTFDRLDSDGCHVHQRHRAAAGLRRRPASRPAADEFTAALTAVCADLAMQLLADAEGADQGHRDHGASARPPRTTRSTVGRAVARNNLFKCGALRQRPQLGPGAGRRRHHRRARSTRPGRRGHQRRAGSAGTAARRATATTVDLTGREVDVDVDLQAGADQATIWTNDLTHAYVHENSAYSS